MAMVIFLMMMRRREIMVSPNHMHVSYASRFLDLGKEPPHPSAYRKTRRRTKVAWSFRSSAFPHPALISIERQCGFAPQIIQISATKNTPITPSILFFHQHIAHNPFWWIWLSNARFIKTPRPAHYLNNSNYYQGRKPSPDRPPEVLFTML